PVTRGRRPARSRSRRSRSAPAKAGPPDADPLFPRRRRSKSASLMATQPGRLAAARSRAASPSSPSSGAVAGARALDPARGGVEVERRHLDGATVAAGARPRVGRRRSRDRLPRRLIRRPPPWRRTCCPREPRSRCRGRSTASEVPRRRLVLGGGGGCAVRAGAHRLRAATVVAAAAAHRTRRRIPGATATAILIAWSFDAGGVSV
ncbi:unnamed protein product, partial [Urochloa humidicola]